MRGAGGAEHTATARTWTRRAEPRGAARRRARLLGVCRTIFSSPLMSFLPAGAEVIAVSEGSADELPEVRVRWTGTSEILGGVEYTVLVSPTSSEGSGEWMSVPLAPVGAFSCPVCRTPLRGLTRDYYPMCIGWDAADRMNSEMGNAYGGPIPPFIRYSHAAWYPEVMAVVRLWCLQNGPHACVRKGYGAGDICHDSMNLSGCTCTSSWV